MQIQVETADLKSLIEEVVGQIVPGVLGQFADGDRPLAYDEPAAAKAIGIPRHVLRDARLRGEIDASRVGKRIVYRREELLAYLERNQLR